VSWEVGTRVTLLQFWYSLHLRCRLKCPDHDRSPAPNCCSGRTSFVCCTPERRGASELSAALRRPRNRDEKGPSRERQQRNRGAAGFRRSLCLVYALQVAVRCRGERAEDERNGRTPYDLKSIPVLPKSPRDMT
jgi:hypothetical protein